MGLHLQVPETEKRLKVGKAHGHWPAQPIRLKAKKKDGERSKSKGRRVCLRGQNLFISLPRNLSNL